MTAVVFVSFEEEKIACQWKKEKAPSEPKDERKYIMSRVSRRERVEKRGNIKKFLLSVLTLPCPLSTMTHCHIVDECMALISLRSSSAIRCNKKKERRRKSFHLSPSTFHSALSNAHLSSLSLSLRRKRNEPR